MSDESVQLEEVLSLDDEVALSETSVPRTDASSAFSRPRAWASARSSPRMLKQEGMYARACVRGRRLLGCQREVQAASGWRRQRI